MPPYCKIMPNARTIDFFAIFYYPNYEELMTNKILIATHRPYTMPTAQIYLPVQVGAYSKKSLGYTRDDSGDNISSLNDRFCELTALYWAWKNTDYDSVGLVHYRRYFAGCEKFNVGGKNKKILSESELENLLERTDIILPQKRHYYIETLYSHYAHTTYPEPLDEAGRIIAEFYPEYSKEFEKLKSRRSAHIFNMFIMKRDLADRYCEWLFDILFKLEQRTDAAAYDKFHARYIGRIGELLLDVWINTNGLKYKEVKVTYTEQVNWIKKGARFLRAKFGNKKYDESSSDYKEIKG